MLSQASHPVRGAWIEITIIVIMSSPPCRTPSGVRGLKYTCVEPRKNIVEVAPRQGCVD